MKRLLPILPLAMLCGCAYMRSTTVTETDPKDGQTKAKTVVRVFTVFDSQSQLTKFKNTTGQVGNGSNVWSFPPGTTIGGLNQESSTTNLNEILGIVVQNAVSGAVKGAK